MSERPTMAEWLGKLDTHEKAQAEKNRLMGLNVSSRREAHHRGLLVSVVHQHMTRLKGPQ